MIDIKFYDTSSLLLLEEEDFNKPFVISSITLEELESIKNSNYKDIDVKAKARKIITLLDKYSKNYHIVFHRKIYEEILIEKGLKHLNLNNDMKILSDAVYYDRKIKPDETIFVTNDLILKRIANLFFGEDMLESINIKNDNYTGYLEVQLSDEQLNDFYTNPNINQFNLNIGQYLIIKNLNNEIIDLRCWTGDTHRYISEPVFSSIHFGKVKPYKNDPYQKLLFDSFVNNESTLVGGPAGSGKSFVALSQLFSLLESNKIDRIVIFCNPIVAKNAAKLGFYPGTVQEKLLSSQIGNILSSKIGSQTEVEKMINSGQIVLIPAGDSRGYEVPANSGVYITEAQNLDIVLLKMILQRIGENCITIVDGDRFTQTDLDIYSGINNGMNRMSQIFRNQNFYGQVDLKYVHRSKISKVAEQM